MGPRTKGLRVSVRLPPWPAVKHCGSGPPKTGAEGSVAPSLKTMADATYRKESNGNWEDDITVVTNNDVNTTGGHKVGLPGVLASGLADYCYACLY